MKRITEIERWTKKVVLEPGNGSRYELLIVESREDEEDDPGYCVIYVNEILRHRSFQFARYVTPFPSYIQEKTGLLESDCREIAQFIKEEYFPDMNIDFRKEY